MTASVAESLFWIVLASVLAPLVAGAVPDKLVPEVVLLLGAGIALGPHALDLAQSSPEIDVLHELGLGALFLLAGYELDPKELSGRGGRRALVTWLCCLGLAFAVLGLLGLGTQINAEIAVAIALTSTALGTLLPILKDRGLVDTALGRTVLNHGAFGELGPIVAMALLLGARGPGASLVVLLLFAVAAIVATAIPRRLLLREESRVFGIIRMGVDTTAQTTVRLTMALLIGLIALAAAFNLDIILGAFAAGFILRRMLPAGDRQLEAKLDGLAYGFLVPIFFVTSGMGIDMAEVIDAPGILVVFFALLLLVRGGTVFASTRFERDAGGQPLFDLRERGQIALYSTTGLPIIVAVTGVAVEAGQMTSANGSILVTAGAITVLLMPLSAMLLGRGRAPSVAG
ncbi:cation:proton antiporter [Aldersonia sp. NBC_00410]|uniref:cation:proton antiporter n=1 Tax=Aldersonia sp. NBC_00410 TaxID=2975954 RepID=UPI00224FB140|nr:cation:proton antiporter [Aldersonia sp. NBC_00410]MCX5042835.1 cation:proton antiporter [Aldersonia sp. NBC_00410]